MDYMLEGMEEEAREGMRRDFDGVLDWVHSVKRGEGNGLYDAMETNKNEDMKYRVIYDGREIVSRFGEGEEVVYSRYSKISLSDVCEMGVRPARLAGARYDARSETWEYDVDACDERGSYTIKAKSCQLRTLEEFLEELEPLRRELNESIDIIENDLKKIIGERKVNK